MEGFIEQQRLRSNLPEEAVATLVQVMGSCLGECVRRSYGGQWKEHDGTWGVFFDDRNAVFPFNKVRKQFDNGVEGGESVLGFFDMIGPVILKNKKR